MTSVSKFRVELVFVELTEKEAVEKGVDGWVLYVTEVTTPHVPPPPPRSAQNKSELQ